MSFTLPSWRATNADLPYLCAICGRPLYGDICNDPYHARCLAAKVDVEPIDGLIKDVVFPFRYVATDPMQSCVAEPLEPDDMPLEALDDAPSSP